jgi:hypothetical protein
MKKYLLMTCLWGALNSCIVQADPSSNITISTTGSHIITGVYLQALAAGACPGASVFNQPANSNFGTMWTGGIALNNQSIDLGANYLYEMIYLAIYEGYQDPNAGGSINFPTTPGSNSYNGGSNAWCIYLGLAGGAPTLPNASVTTSLLAFSSARAIPIICDDTTITCTTASPVTQAF